MQIAVIGSGVSGLVSAWLLSKSHAVTLYEADDRLGGHVHTHQLLLKGRGYCVDSGFIVHNPLNYPLFSRLLDELGVASQPTSMSFSVRNENTGLEYNAGSWDQLFCQRQNLTSPRFYRMIFDLLRFHREARELLRTEDPGPTLEEYLRQRGFGAAFRDDNLVPMASALWSAPGSRILDFPARYLVQFMANHRMLQVADRPIWYVVRGGSAQYVKALRSRWSVVERLRSAVRSVRRDGAHVELTTDNGRERFDQVVLACHSDQAAALLTDASEQERDILGAIPYQQNEAILHTDSAVMPLNRRAWAAWNAFVPVHDSSRCRISYYMNLLHGLDAPAPLIVTLNGAQDIDAKKVLRTMRYAHPVYNHSSVAARARKPEIQGLRRTWFAGAYWGWGFHEDGMRSAVEVADALGVRWPSGGRGAADPWPATSHREAS